MTSTTSLLRASPEPPQPAASDDHERATSGAHTLCRSVTRSPDVRGRGGRRAGSRARRVTRASAAAEDVRDAAARAGRQRLALQRVLEALGRDALGRAVHGQQGEEVAGRARQRARAADDVDPALAEVRVDLGARVALVAEQEHRAEQVIEPSAARADDDDPGRLERDRGVERELEVGRVLGGRMPLDAGARRFGCCEPCRRDRVEVADREVDVQPERERPVDAAVGGDHDGRRRAAPGSGSPEECPPATTMMVSGFTRIPPLALPRSGSAGRWRVEPPSQPGRARAPRFASAIVA